VTSAHHYLVSLINLLAL